MPASSARSVSSCFGHAISCALAAARVQSSASVASETAFLDGLVEDSYRLACQQLLELCRGLNLKFEWGAKGTSIRAKVPGKAQPVSIAWAFPPGVVGWMGLSHLTFGFDATLLTESTVLDALASYTAGLSALPGSQNVTNAGLKASTFDPAAFVDQQTAIADLLGHLVATIAGDDGEEN
jgi:hypothetical protein